MPNLILVRHSLPQIIPSRPANQWHLSAEGRRRCKSLAKKLRAYQPEVVLTSAEPKAIETGQLVAEWLNKPRRTAEGLHEHERPHVPFGTRESFERSVAEFFAHPDQLVFGAETAEQAYQRFSRAIARATERYPVENLAVVTHGTVMTLFLAGKTGVEPFPFWQRLELPCFVVLSRPEFKLLTVGDYHVPTETR